MKRGSIIIPLGPADIALESIARAKGQAWELLAEVERAAGASSSGRPGIWRHDPVGWMKNRR